MCVHNSDCGKQMFTTCFGLWPSLLGWRSLHKQGGGKMQRSGVIRHGTGGGGGGGGVPPREKE